LLGVCFIIGLATTRGHREELRADARVSRNPNPYRPGSRTLLAASGPRRDKAASHPAQ